jgi:hypothetical protein
MRKRYTAEQREQLIAEVRASEQAGEADASKAVDGESRWAGHARAPVREGPAGAIDQDGGSEPYGARGGRRQAV